MIAEMADETLDLATGRLNALLQRYVPELLSSLSLVGSAVDGDFRAGRSDLDFVAVLAHPATADDLEALTIVHRIYASDPTLPPLDGIWVTAADLAAGPEAAADGPVSHANAFVRSGRGNRNPVTWAMLRQLGRTIAGTLDREAVREDPVQLAAWTRQNVEDYWVGWHARAAKLATPLGLRMLGREAPMWGVLGISRLHHTLATGRIVSKSGAGAHALEAFPHRWHRILEECLRIRRGEAGSLYGNPLRRRREALEFVEMVVDAIRRTQRG